MDSYKMVLFPSIFLALLQFAFLSLSPDDSVLDDAVTVVYNATMWTSPDDPKYDTFFGNDPIGWFADNTYVLALKIGSVFIVAGLFLFPFATLPIPIAITGGLSMLFIFLYGMVVIGGYKTLSPFVGR